MSMFLFLAAVAGSVSSGAPGVEVIRGNEISSSKPAVAVQASVNPRAMDLVDSDPAIQQWAIKRFDSNRDGWLTLYEAQPAIGAFQDIADEDRNGRVTVQEYRAAIDFLKSRY